MLRYTYIVHLALYFRSATTVRTSVLFQDVYVHRHIFVKAPSIKFHRDPCIGSRSVIWGRTDGRVNMARIICAFRDLRERAWECMKIIKKVILTESGFEIHKTVLVLRPFHIFCHVDTTLILVRPGQYLYYSHLATMCRLLSVGGRASLIWYKYLVL